MKTITKQAIVKIQSRIPRKAKKQMKRMGTWNGKVKYSCWRFWDRKIINNFTPTIIYNTKYCGRNNCNTYSNVQLIPHNHIPLLQHQKQR